MRAAADGPIWRIVSYDEIDEMITAPLRAALYVTRAFLPAMLRRGTGTIGNVTFNRRLSSLARCDRMHGGALGHARAARSHQGGFARDQSDGEPLVALRLSQTEYWSRHHMRVPVTPSWIPVLRPDEVACASLDALQNRKSVLVIPKGMLLLACASPCPPRMGRSCDATSDRINPENRRSIEVPARESFRLRWIMNAVPDRPQAPSLHQCEERLAFSTT